MASVPPWHPRWYLWDGGFMAIGRSSGVVPPHAHHAVQVVIGVDGPVRIAEGGAALQVCNGAIVKPDVPHSFDGNGALGLLLFVDPESREGAWLRSSLTMDVTFVPERRLRSCVEELRTFHERPLEGLDTGELIRHCVQALCVGAPPLRRLDERVASVIARLRASEDLRVSLADAAASVFLSPSRFAHLFTEHVGLPFRRYVLWRKLTRAMLAIGRGVNMAQAAHASGFADAAHLTRTFNQMFGIPPTVMMRGDFFEIESPYEPH